MAYFFFLFLLRENGIYKIQRKTRQFNAMSRCRYESPHAILVARIVIWVVWRAYYPLRGRDLVLAAALLAVVAILVQRKAIVTRALIRANCVSTVVLATPIVVGALVHVSEEHGGESRFVQAEKPQPTIVEIIINIKIMNEYL